MVIYILAGIWAASALLSAVVGFKKGRPGTGLVMGLLLGCLGLLFTCLMDSESEGAL